jgi:hypothetical protein
MISSILLHISWCGVITLLVVHKKKRSSSVRTSAIGVVLLTNKSGDEWAIMIPIDSKLISSSKLPGDLMILGHLIVAVLIGDIGGLYRKLLKRETDSKRRKGTDDCSTQNRAMTPGPHNGYECFG